MDAMGVARNVVLEPKLLPGGGACEMAVARALTIKADTIEGVEQWPYRAVAAGLEVRGTQGRGCEGVWSRELRQWLRGKRGTAVGKTRPLRTTVETPHVSLAGTRYRLPHRVSLTVAASL
jgi:hypothetical protein